MFKWFIRLLLDSEAQEIGRVWAAVTVIAYYVNWQPMPPSYMTLLVWSLVVCVQRSNQTIL